MRYSHKGLAVTPIHLAKTLALECQTASVSSAHSLVWDTRKDDGGVMFPSRKAHFYVSMILPPYFAESVGQ